MFSSWMPRPCRESSTSPATAGRSAPVRTRAAQASAGSRRSGRAASSSSSTAAFSAADRVSSADLLSLTCSSPVPVRSRPLAPEFRRTGARARTGRTRATGGAAQRPAPGHRYATPAPPRWSAIPGPGVVADVAVPDASLHIDPDVAGVAGASLLPQEPGPGLVPRAHQLLRWLARHLGALGVAAAGHVVNPAQHEIAAGKVLAPGPGIEPRLAFAGARQGQVLLQRGDTPDLIVTGLLHPVRDLLDALLQRRPGHGERRDSFFAVRRPNRGGIRATVANRALGLAPSRRALRYGPAGRRWLRRWPRGPGQ